MCTQLPLFCYFYNEINIHISHRFHQCTWFVFIRSSSSVITLGYLGFLYGRYKKRYNQERDEKFYDLIENIIGELNEILLIFVFFDCHVAVMIYLAKLHINANYWKLSMCHKLALLWTWWQHVYCACPVCMRIKICVEMWFTLYCISLLKIYSNHNMPCTETTHQRSHILPSAMSGILWSLPKTGLHYLVFLLQNSYQNFSFEMQMLKWEVVYFPFLTENMLHPYIHHWLIYIDSIEWRCWKVLWKQYDLKLKKI